LTSFTFLYALVSYKVFRKTRRLELTSKAKMTVSCAILTFRKGSKMKQPVLKSEAVLSGKGQVTLPQEVRQRLGLKQGDRIEFVLEGELTVLRPARKDANPFEAYAGALGNFETKEDINQWVATLRDEQD
jgi:antitoxin PrlF